MADLPSIETADELLITRLLPPPLRPSLVARKRLREELRNGLAHGLALIAAPAGSGKSTLLAQALADARATDPHIVTAWLALDAGDDDPPRFWRYLIAALERAAPGTWQRAEQLLGATAARPAEPLVIALINAAAALERPLILAIDDYHLINTPEIHAGVALLAERAPPQLQLVLASRSMPPLPLERLRVRGHLAELRSSDLRFTLDEAAELFEQVLGLPLPPATLADLVARTEGWGAGLILAALAARGHSQPGQTIAAFRGSAPALVDYIAAEVLGGQPPELRAFLLRSAALDRFSAELCDALRDESATPEPPAAELLAQIERANLFLIALDDERRWFRYHHLFAEVLRAHVARSDPTALRVTRLRAASWLADHGATAEAIGLALAAEEWPLAAQLIAEVGRATLLRSEVLTLRGWLQALPPATRSASPPLLLLDGWVRVLLSDLDGAAELAKAVSASATEFQGEVQMLLTMIAILRGAATAQPAGVGKGSAFLKIIATLNEGFLAQFSGDVPAAIQAFVAATQSNQAEGNDLISFIAWCQLGEVQILQGRPRAAEASYRRARDLSYSAGERQAPFADAALVGLGVAAYERGDLEQAASLITAGLSRRSILGDLAAVDGLQHLALLAALRGDNQEAAEHLRAAEAVVESLSASIFTTIVVAGQAQLIARSNDRAAATAWLASNPPPTAEPTLSAEIAMLARAQVLQMLGQHRATLDLATLVAEQAAAGGRGRHQAQALVLRALALAGLGQHAAARVALAEAHALADPTGMVAVFLEAGPALAALEQPHTPELLTPREIEVLRLIEAGLSNGEIAAQIVVAPSTVKKHINRIFDKLAVGSRTQALARARTLGLLG